MNTPKAPRDTRLDAVRGLLLLIMAGEHVPTPVSHAMHDPLGFMSNAEGFIFLSGCLAGLVYGRTYWREGWQAMSRRVWRRTGKIYFFHLAVLLPVVLLAWMLAAALTPLANHFHYFLVHPWGSLALMPLLLYQPPLFDILPLYIIFLGTTPLLFAIARRRGWGIILALSALGWLAVQLNLFTHLTDDFPQWLPVRWGAFNLAAWQFIWVTGVALGETSHRQPLLAGKSRAAVGALSAVLVLTGLLARHGFFTFNPDWYLWMDKWTLGPLRLLNFAAWGGLLLAWNPRLPARPLAPLALLGRNSLAVFSFHLLLVVAASTLVQSIQLSSVMQTVVGLAVMAALFPWAAWLERQPKPAQPSPVADAINAALNFWLKFWKRQSAA